MASDLQLSKSIYYTAIDGVASFPEVMTEIRNAISDPKATPQSVGRAVERDVAFASRLLRIVNSPAAGLVRPCGSLPHAVTLIGLQRIGMHAETVASLQAISQCASIAPEITKRVAAEAAIARTLATAVGASAEHAYTAMLLADIGIIAILATQPNWSGEEGSVPSHTEEKARLGFDHAELGSDIVRRWNLPSPIPEVIAVHHDQTAAHAVSYEVERLVLVMQAAEYLAPGVQADDTPAPNEWAEIEEHPALKALGLDAVDVATLWPKLQASLEEDSDARNSGIPVAPTNAKPEPQKKKQKRPMNKSFMMAMFAAIAIPAAVGFELFFRR